jgi:hypothetical protein
MSDKPLDSDPTHPASRIRANGKSLDTVPDLLESLGGEQLEGSGFEREFPEPDYEWRDPQ